MSEINIFTVVDGRIPLQLPQDTTVLKKASSVIRIVARSRPPTNGWGRSDLVFFVHRWRPDDPERPSFTKERQTQGRLVSPPLTASAFRHTKRKAPAPYPVIKKDAVVAISSEERSKSAHKKTDLVQAKKGPRKGRVISQS